MWFPCHFWNTLIQQNTPEGFWKNANKTWSIFQSWVGKACFWLASLNIALHPSCLSSVFTIIDTAVLFLIVSHVICHTALLLFLYCVWWHPVLRGLMSYHQESLPELAFSNCEHSLKTGMSFFHGQILSEFVSLCY